MRIINSKLFSTLTKDEKLAFFLQCQEILIQNHPESDFLFRENNIHERLLHAKSLINKYRGYCYMDNNICVLFNKIYIPNPKDPILALKDSMFQEPHPNYNGMSIDFVVFDKLPSCALWCRAQYESKLEYVLYVKNNKPQIYKTETLMSKVINFQSAFD